MSVKAKQSDSFPSVVLLGTDAHRGSMNGGEEHVEVSVATGLFRNKQTLLREEIFIYICFSSSALFFI